MADIRALEAVTSERKKCYIRMSYADISYLQNNS